MAVNKTLAEIAYCAYGDTTGQKNYRGKPMLKWNDLPSKIQYTWKAAVKAVSRYERGAEKRRLRNKERRNNTRRVSFR